MGWEMMRLPLSVKVSLPLFSSSHYIPLLSTADKCLGPYSGGCPSNMVCKTTEFDVGCECFLGFIPDPNNSTECIRKTTNQHENIMLISVVYHCS